MKTLIHTTPNATVTISKGTTVKTKQADENGDALFSVTVGAWSVKCEANGAEVTGQIVVNDTIELDLPVGQKLSEMALKSKLKLGSYKFILANRDVYGVGYQNLATEYPVQMNVAYGGLNYDVSNFKPIANAVYDTFTANEKTKVILTSRNVINTTGGTTPFSEYTFVAQSSEIGQLFPTQSDRIMYQQGGGAVEYWLSNANRNGGYSHVNQDGTDSYYNPSTPRAVRAFCNLIGDTLISPNPDSEGYYTIL